MRQAAVLVTVAATAPKKRKSSTQSARMRLLASHWERLSSDVRAVWNFAHAPLQDPAHPRNDDADGPTGYTAFCACNSALLTANSPIIHSAPPCYSPPPPLPPVHITVAFAGTAPRITLVPDRAVLPGPKLVLWATKGVPNDNSLFGSQAYYKIGVLTGGIPLGGVSIEAQYLSVFPTPPLSAKIGFKVFAVSGSGFLSNTVDALGVTPALSLSAEAAEFGTPGLRAA